MICITNHLISLRKRTMLTNFCKCVIVLQDGETCCEKTAKIGPLTNQQLEITVENVNVTN
jgi:hypothetical protein